eukprot:3559381-Prymnesium_polylepis.1
MLCGREVQLELCVQRVTYRVAELRLVLEGLGVGDLQDGHMPTNLPSPNPTDRPYLKRADVCVVHVAATLVFSLYLPPCCCSC